MVDKFFLALDFGKDSDMHENGLRALDFLEREFGVNFVSNHLGVKLNQDALTGPIDGRHRVFKDERGCAIFADMKIIHGYDTGKRIIDRLLSQIPVDYITIAAGLGKTILREYVEIGYERDIDIIAFTAHTKIPEEEVRKMYRGQTLNNVIYNMGEIAYEAGCHAIVLEGSRLRSKKISSLPIRKLVTGVRINPEDKGTQSRVTSLSELAQIKDVANYVVVSSRYVRNLETLRGYFTALL